MALGSCIILRLFLNFSESDLEYSYNLYSQVTPQGPHLFAPLPPGHTLLCSHSKDATLAMLLLAILETEKVVQQESFLMFNMARGGARNFPMGGLTLPTLGLKYGFQGTINAKNLQENCVTPSDGG